MKLALGLALLVACGESTAPDDADPDAPGGNTIGDATQLGVFVGMQDGARVAGNVFASKEDAFFGTQFVVAGPLVARDHYFRVLDTDGRIVSTSALECRR